MFLRYGPHTPTRRMLDPNGFRSRAATSLENYVGVYDRRSYVIGMLQSESYLPSTAGK